MGKIHRFYFASALLLIFFSCMQAAKCNPVAPDHSITPTIHFQTPAPSEQSGQPFTWEEEEENTTILPLVTAISYRSMNGKSGKILFSSPVRLPYFRFRASGEPENTYLRIWSGRRSNGFYLYFLKKLLI